MFSQKVLQEATKVIEEFSGSFGSLAESVLDVVAPMIRQEQLDELEETYPEIFEGHK